MQSNFFLFCIIKIILLFILITLSYFSEKGISPDVITYTTLMKAYIRAKKFHKVLTYPLATLIFVPTSFLNFLDEVLHLLSMF